MKIGLMGAPGSGKTALAEAIHDTYGLPIIDNYAADLEERSGYALGRYATYAMNIAVAIERHFRELDAEDAYVTCGTVLDTLCYEAVKASEWDDADTRRLSGGLVVLGCMVDDLMAYDHLFLLPCVPQDEFTGRIARSIEEAMEVFNVSYTLLDQISAEERAAQLYRGLSEHES